MNRRLENLDISDENGGSVTLRTDQINYLIMCDGTYSKDKEPYSLAAAALDDGPRMYYNTMEAFDTNEFSGRKPPSPFSKFDIYYDAIDHDTNGMVRACARKDPEDRTGHGTLLVNRENLDYARTREVNCMRRRNLVILIFRNGVRLDVRGSDIRYVLSQAFPGMEKDKTCNPWLMYLGWKPFHVIEVDRVEAEDHDELEGAKMVRAILKNGKIHRYVAKKTYDGEFNIMKFLEAMGFPTRYFRLDEKGNAVARHRWDVRPEYTQLADKEEK